MHPGQALHQLRHLLSLLVFEFPPLLLAGMFLSAQNPGYTDVQSIQFHLKTGGGFRSRHVDGGAKRDICECLPRSPCSVREVENLPGDRAENNRAKAFQLSSTVPSLPSF